MLVAGARVPTGPTQASPSSLPANRYHPFPNLSSYLLGQWFWDDCKKSRDSFYDLLSILTDGEFNPQDLLSANWYQIQASLTSSRRSGDRVNDVDGKSEWINDGLSWQTTAMSIDVPFHSRCARAGSEPYQLDGFRFRPITSVIRAKLQEKGGGDYFHVVPFNLRWQPKGSEDLRLYGELYHSPMFLQAYKEVQASLSSFSAGSPFVSTKRPLYI